jgi:hypothetical protein
MPPAERYCSKCGANRELELAVAGELDPAIGSLRRWLAALGAISLVLAWLLYSDLRRFAGLSSEEAMRALWPSFALALGLLFLFVVARLFPLAASLTALGLFAGTWVFDATRIGATLFTPSIGLVIRTIFLLVLAGAIQAGWKARVLRARAAEDFPSAVVRTKKPRPTSR